MAIKIFIFNHILLFIAILLSLFLWFWPKITKRGKWLALGLCLFLGLVHLLIYRTNSEDAFIVYRYSMNMATGNGPVFNPGDRVEGYSDFLWMVLLSIIYWLTGVSIPTTARIIGSLSAIICIYITYRLCYKLTSDYYASVIASFIVSSSGVFAAYGTSGLETPLFTLLLTLTFLLYTYRDIEYNVNWFGVGLLIGLSTMARPEGILLLFVFMSVILVSPDYSQNRSRHVGKLLSSYGILILPWFLWRVLYYGYVIPNPISAKSGMNLIYQIQLGLEYLINFICVNGPLMLIIAIYFVLNRKKFKDIILQMSHHQKLIFYSIIVYVTFVVSVGGDWMPALRFFAPIMPILVVLIISLWAMSDACPKTSSRGGLIIFLIVAWISFGISIHYENMRPAIREGNNHVEALSQIGKWLNITLPNTTKIAVHANGALSYYSKLDTIDMLGLTDRHIAREGFRLRWGGAAGHSAYDYGYVAKQRPDIVLFSGVGYEIEPNIDYRREYVKYFRDAYVPVSFKWTGTKTTHLGRYVNLLVLKDKQAELSRLLTNKNGVEIAEGDRGIREEDF